jgi:RimJ/RimL family protein N-acetyltransferase
MGVETMTDAKVSGNNLLRGDLVRLTAPDVDTDVEVLARWSHDSEYLRLQDGAVARPKRPDPAHKQFDESQQVFRFVIRPLESDTAIGFSSLRVAWSHGDAWFGIGLGDRAYWSKGYGTEAARLTLRYAFTELNLQRVSLTVLEGNDRAQRAYTKAGFVYEGMWRENSRYDGQWYGEVFMGILRTDWEAQDRLST